MRAKGVTAAVGFADELWAAGAEVRRAIHAHPFVRGLGDGSLPLPRFLRYLRQDYAFLRDYARVLALAAAAAERPEDMEALAGLLHATLHQEMELHRQTCAGLGIGRAELDAVRSAPFTFCYTRHLLCVARAGTLGEIAAALLPCQWGYAELGAELAAAGPPGVPPYAAWIATYADPAYRRTARWLWDLVDRLGAEMGQGERRRAAAAFEASLRCEHAFWDGCWSEPPAGGA